MKAWVKAALSGRGYTFGKKTGGQPGKRSMKIRPPEPYSWNIEELYSSELDRGAAIKRAWTQGKGSGFTDETE